MNQLKLKFDGIENSDYVVQRIEQCNHSLAMGDEFRTRYDGFQASQTEIKNLKTVSFHT